MVNDFGYLKLEYL